MHDSPSIEISRVSHDQLDSLAVQLTKCSSLSWRFLPDIPRHSVEQLLLETVTANISDDNAGVIAAYEDGRLIGIAAHSALPWESKILSCKSASLTVLSILPTGSTGASLEKLIASAIESLRARGCELITTKTYTTDIATIHALQTQGFLLMDTMVDVVYHYPITWKPLPTAEGEKLGFTIRLAKKSDTEELRSLARASFPNHFGRFHSDPKIGPELGTRIYEEWIQACIEGWCDWVFVAEKNGRLAGFSAWRKPIAAELRHGLRIGHYSIGAIHPAFQGQGLFKLLTSAGINVMREFADYLEGPTHVHNIPVQRGYLKLGWQISDSRHSFHRWL